VAPAKRARAAASAKSATPSVRRTKTASS
jgi:hypothetical protein